MAVARFRVDGVQELASQFERLTPEASRPVGVTSDLEYPWYLEFGTRYMSPRPSAGPAFDAAQEDIGKAIENDLGRQIDAINLRDEGQSLEVGAEIYAARWRSLAPFRTGRYRGSIRVERGLDE